MPESIRSFIAFDIDNNTILEKITSIQNLMTKTRADLKLVEPKRRPKR